MTHRTLLPRRLARWLLLALMAPAIAALAACTTRQPPAGGNVTVTLAHVNDTHGRPPADSGLPRQCDCADR